jgi:putative transposase
VSFVWYQAGGRPLKQAKWVDNEPRNRKTVMIDENETNTGDETVEADAMTKVSEPKKRATRRTPAEMTAAATLKSQKAKSAKKPAQAEKSKPAAAVAPAPKKTPAGKISVDTEATVAAAAAAGAPSTAADEMAELSQLEEENRGLRKALSEKLRAENADLRKRLGHS